MSYLDKINPAGGIADFWHEFRRPNPYRWPVLLISFLITGSILSMIIWEKVRIPPERPTVTYITSFAPDRTDAEIAASNLANQKLQDERRAEQARRDAQAREMYKTIGAASGMDVEKIEREAEAERKAAEKAEAEAIAARRAQAQAAIAAALAEAEAGKAAAE